jgi:hypothetical protein
VRSLLTSWTAALASVQCVYVRSNLRERRDLLAGWDGSPLARLAKGGGLRNIPFPTRRATLKEVTRCYDELMTVVTSPTSALESLAAAATAAAAAAAAAAARREPKPAGASKLAPAEGPPKGKGTSHLKKRTEAPPSPAAPAAVGAEDVADEEPVEEPVEEVLPVEAAALALVKACVDGDVAALSAALGGDAPAFPHDATFHAGYFAGIPALAAAADAGATLGLVGVACVSGNVESTHWLLEAGAPPTAGASPYLTTASKAARTALRRFWAAHPASADALAAAGVPGPLTDADVDAAAARRRRERAKKRARKDAREEEAKPEAVRAREARAAAAEARLLGGGGAAACAQCRASLAGAVPFERLQFKYCSTDCVCRHREALAADARRAGR